MEDHKRYFLVDNSDCNFSSVDEIKNIDHLVASHGGMSFYINGSENSQVILDWFNDSCQKYILELSDNPDYPYDDRLPNYLGTAFLVAPAEDGFGKGTKGYSFSVDEYDRVGVVAHQDSNTAMHYVKCWW